MKQFVFIMSFLGSFFIVGCTGTNGSISSSSSKMFLEKNSPGEIHEGDTFQIKVSRAATHSSTTSTDSTSASSKPEIRSQISYSGDFLASDIPTAPLEFIIPENQDDVIISFQIPSDGLFDTGKKLLKVISADGALLETEISNTDSFPVLSLSSTQASEGQNAVLTLQLDRGSRVPLEFDYEFQFVSASSGDINNSDDSVVIAAGLTSTTINISLKADGTCENGETFSVLVQPPSGFGSSQAAGVTENFTITDTTLPVYQISSVSLAEGSSSSVNLSSDMTCPFDRTMTVSTQNISATSGSDYTAIVSQDFTITSGSTFVSVPVATLDDSLNENIETFSVNVVAASKGTVSGSGVVTMTDNDPLPTLTLTSSNSTIAESAGTVLLGYTLTPTSGRNVQATISLGGTATAGSDYTAPMTTLIIPAGTTSGNISIPMTNDSSYEPSETITLALGSLVNGNAGLTMSYTLTITDNDSPPTVSLSAGPTADEGTNASFTLTLSQASGFSSSVDITTQNGTAFAGTDFTTNSSTILFAAGETSKTFSVTTLNDSTPCQTDRTFTAVISNPVNANLGTASSTATIKDNDNPTVSISDVSVTEGGSATLTANLQMACTKIASFNWATQNNTALASTDYTAASGSVSFAIGESSKTFSVSTVNDIIDQGTRNFKINFSNPSNIELPVAATTVTINDNDTAPEISWSVISGPLASQTVTESQGSVLLSVYLSHPTNRIVTASVAANGTAVSTVDYNLPTTNISIPVGASSAQFTVNVLRDNEADDGKVLTLTLSSVSGEPLGTPSVFDLTILDDPYQGPLMAITTDSTKLTHLSGINSALVLGAGVPSANTGARLSQNSAGSPKVQDFFWSGDSSKIVFLGNIERAANFDIFSINPNGTSRLRLNPSGWPNSRNILKAQSVQGTTRVIYQFDQTTSGLMDIASVNLDGSSSISLVSGLNVGTESVKDFSVAPNGSKVVYVADTAILGRFEIFSVSPTGSGTQKLNLSLSAGQSVERFKISPDSTKVAFIVSSGSNSTKTDLLYISPIGGGSSTLISVNLSSRQIVDFGFSPDSAKVAYTHNATSLGILDLYTANINGSSRVKINPVYSVGGGVNIFKFTPDSSKIGFLADNNYMNEMELYIGAANGSSCCTKLNASLVTGGKIETFDFTTNSSYAVYLGKQDSAVTSEVFAITTTGLQRVKLNLTPVTNGYISKFLILPDNSRVIYIGDQDTQGQSEVYSVNLTASSRTKLNPDLAVSRKIDAISVLPNSSKVLYRGNVDDLLKYEWYSIQPTGGTPTKLFSPD